MELSIKISREAGKGHLITAWLCSELTCITETCGVCSSLRHINSRREARRHPVRRSICGCSDQQGSRRNWLEKQPWAGGQGPREGWGLSSGYFWSQAGPRGPGHWNQKGLPRVGAAAERELKGREHSNQCGNRRFINCLWEKEWEAFM